MQALNVRLQFGGVVALNNVSLEIRDDELLAIIGPNGAGKSSLMNCFERLLPALGGAGAARRQRHPRSAGAPHRADGPGPHLQGTHIFLGHDRRREPDGGTPHPHAFVTGAGLRLFRCGAARGDRTPREGRGRSSNCWRSSRYATSPWAAWATACANASTSGRALAQDPKILLMDEPMAGMNSEEKEDMARFHRRARGGAHSGGAGRTRHGRSWTWLTASPCSTSAPRSPEGTPQQMQRDPAVLKAYLGRAIDEADDPAANPAERVEQTPQRLSQRHKHRGIWREYSFAQVRDQVRSLALGPAGWGSSAGRDGGGHRRERARAFLG